MMTPAELLSSPWADLALGAVCAVNVGLFRPRGALGLVSLAALAASAVILVSRALLP